MIESFGWERAALETERSRTAAGHDSDRSNWNLSYPSGNFEARRRCEKKFVIVASMKSFFETCSGSDG